MPGRVTPNWDALASSWHCFEIYGLDQPILSATLSSLIPPVLYVGGGRGTYAACLRDWLGQDTVTVVDSSLAMAQRARTDFGLAYVLSDARYLPMHDNAFASVICATGVMEYLDQSDQKQSLREMARVCSDGGLILIIAFASPDLVGTTASHGTDEHSLLETWYRHYDALSFTERRVMSAFNAVAREMGDREAAYRLLKASLPHYNQSLIISDFATTISAAGLFNKSIRFVAERGVGIWHLIQPDGKAVE